MSRWKLVQWKPCDGEGCCDRVGAFCEDGFHGKCRYWVEAYKGLEGKSCMLMANPQLQQEELTPSERRLFKIVCLDYPIPGFAGPGEYSRVERDALSVALRIGQECCWRWEKLTQ